MAVRVPTFFNYAIADGLRNHPFPNKTGIGGSQEMRKLRFHLFFGFSK